MDWKSPGGVNYRAAYAAKYYTADTNVAEHLTMLKMREKTLKKEMKMWDWEVTSRDSASMVENPP